MKLFIQIGLITLLFIFKYQSVGADTINASEVSYLQEYKMTGSDAMTASASNQNSLDNYSYTNSCITGNQQLLIKLMPEDLRIRRAEDLQHSFLKVLIGRFSLRETNLAADKEKCFPSYVIHCVSPSCKYFVFALRRILI